MSDRGRDLTVINSDRMSFINYQDGHPRVTENVTIQTYTGILNETGHFIFTCTVYYKDQPRSL